jgi:pyrroloquinoline-quinone synthase
MERKVHWAWPQFTSGNVSRAGLEIHLQQEYACYVRDFPRLVCGAYMQCDVAAVRRALIENVYEEETGGIAAGRPHPELFLEYPRGLGMDVSAFERVQLLPGAASYRRFLDAATTQRGWEVGAAVATLFVEGTAYERGELEAHAPKRPTPPLEDHPLVRHYGLPLEHLALTKAHRTVEGDHRAAAWRAVLEHAAAGVRTLVVDEMQRALGLWLDYRDDVARACGISRV